MKIARRTCESSTGDCTLERDLAGGEYHLVIRVITVPAGDQFLGGLANVLTVADAAGEYARDVQPLAKVASGPKESGPLCDEFSSQSCRIPGKGSKSCGSSWLCNDFPIARKGFWLYA